MVDIEVHRPALLDVLEPQYAPLFDRLTETFLEDERVRAMWLSGSIARGTADIVSDLDVLIAVADEALDSFAGEWKQWLARATPSVIARPLPFLPGSLYSVTPERARLDVVVEPVGAVASTMFRHRVMVFDRDGLDALVPAVDAGSGPSTVRIAQLIEEFFRDYGMFPVGVARDDWLLAIEAIHFLRGLLYQLFVEENAPLPPSGVKQWSSKLTDRQRSVLFGLPCGGSDPTSIIDAHEQVARAFVTEARRVASDHGVSWPDELEACTRRYLQGWDLPALD